MLFFIKLTKISSKNQGQNILTHYYLLYYFDFKG